MADLDEGLADLLTDDPATFVRVLAHEGDIGDVLDPEVEVTVERVRRRSTPAATRRWGGDGCQ
jgi:hypothetical protein